MTEEGKAPLNEESAESKNFILNFIDEDIAEGCLLYTSPSPRDS